MIKTTNAFLKEINKLGGRKFVSKVLIRDKEYNDDNIIDMSLNESVNPGDNFSLGSVVSNTFEINLINVDDIFENAVVKPYIGLEIDNEIEYIPLGVFIVDEVSKKDKKVKLQCVDNMFNLERAYFSDLSYPANLNEVLKEICTKAKITCNSILPNYSIDEIKGYSFRQAIGIIATLAGCFARFNRLGELEILSYEDTDLRITPDIFFKFETNDKDYIIGKITAKKGEKTFSKGANTEIIIDNPVITESIVNDLYNKFKDFTYRPYTLSWQGNPAVQAGDRVTIVGIDSKEYNTLIMNHKLTYSGGITSELKATGKTESSDKFDSKGSITQAIENYSIEQANIKKALIEKADIDSLNAIDARINNLYTQDLTALKANIKELQSNKISTVEFNATKAEIQTMLVSKADINLLNAQGAKINTLEAKTISVENQLAGNLTAKNFQAGAITAGSGIIAEGAIGDAEISSLSGNKLRFGTIDTSLVSILGPNGRLRLQGNKLQVFDNKNGKLFERVMLGVDDNNNSSLILRGADGKTILLNQDGLTKEGITEGFGKIADNSLDAKKFDKNSLVREVNGATETIKGTRVQIGDRTLDIELSTQNNTITEHGKELSSQKATIQALDNAIKLKVDNQTFVKSTSTINSNINNLNSDLVSKINSSLNNAKSYADAKKQEAINNASTDATNKANSALNSAKAYTTAQITTTNSNLSKATSEINILKEQINTKVGQVDIDKSIENIQIGGRNLLIGFSKYTEGNKYKITANRDDNYISIPSATVNLISGKKYTFSIETDCINWGSSGDSVEAYLLLDNSYTHIIYIRAKTYTFIPTITGEYTLRLDVNKNGSTHYFWNAKIEKGQFNTGWSPAPEDTTKVITDNIKVVTDKINTVESNLKQTKDSLQASVNSLNSTTQIITTNLTNTTNDLSTKINKAKTDAINTSNSHADSVATAKANIAKQQAIDSANSHADSVSTSKSNEALNNAKTYTNAQITTVNTRVSNAESSINILKNQISTKVSQSDIDKSIQNITIGGRNLLGNSNFLKDTEFTDTTPTLIGWLREENEGVHSNYNGRLLFINNNGDKVGDSYTSIGLGCSVKENTDYTLSFDYWGAGGFKNQDASSSYIWAITDGANIPIRINHPTISDKVRRRYSQTFTFPKGTTKILIRTGFFSISYAWMCFDGFKFEEGNKATDWTPAPEDLQQEIKDNITTVTTKISNVESNLKQTKDSLQASVEAVSLKTNSVSNSLNETKNDLLNRVNSAIDTSKKYADEVAVAKANLAQANAIANADGKITAEEQKRIQQAKDNLNTAIAKADAAKAEAVNLSKQYANTQLNNAKDYTNSAVASVKSQITVDLNGIKTEVSKKTDKDNIISAINQSAEEIKIDASRIKINGLTTFASKTGLKAIEIESNNILFYDWEGSERKEPVGKLYSTRSNGDVNKPGLAIGHEENSMFDIVYKQGDTYISYIGFDKYKAACPITLFEDINLNGCLMYLSSKKINSIYESTSDTFCIETKHGLNVFDKDSKATIANLGSSRVGFSKWDQKYYYAEFFPDGFSLGNGKGKSYFWVKADESTIWTAGGVSMGIQGNLTVSGKKNRVVETSIGNLALNAL
ncbi:hypothetical protein J2Z53_001460 [Clostridium moniliforme]|uniref:KID repeat family protein n=1 Tax=Clostridium moniliforme TaxID=39489 RepID=A0ABS4F1B4_9CLOT|nr:hypothetical protein [Clostridium moniliforme]MBP1889877.1 hypothetical protein [Clostridium moniliforme]